jgi:Na+/H+ antiporter NhaD/arsenite permease-like protein
MVTDWIIAGATVAAVALRPRSLRATGLAVVLAGADLATGGGSLGPALAAVWPMVTLLVGALSVSALAIRLGAAAWAASALARAARGRAARLYVLVCALAAVLTACVTLDGAVVLLAPVVVELDRRFGAPRRALLLGVVAVANAFSVAVPLGNPTNLVVIERLGLGLGETTARLFPAAVAAALLCSSAVAVAERRALRGVLGVDAGPAPVRGRAGGLGAVARVALQVVSLLVVLLGVVEPRRLATAGLWSLLALALGVTVFAAVANNLPASAVVAAAIPAGPAAYAALVGLSVGALATPQGSVATLLAGDLADERSHSRVLAPAALAATVAAVIVVWLGA